MTNHVRTLLLNLPAVGAGEGERYIPNTYRPVTLSTRLRAARTALLGPDTTRTVLCVRVDRLLQYAHHCPLAADLLRDDTRLTYDPREPAPSGYSVEPDGVWTFASAVEGDFTDVFRPFRSTAGQSWYRTWRATDPAPTRAVALALALAVRISEEGGL